MGRAAAFGRKSTGLKTRHYNSATLKTVTTNPRDRLMQVLVEVAVEDLGDLLDFG